jgi:hypothetical protein
MQYVKQSTSSFYLQMGPFLDESDGYTPETGLSISYSNVYIHSGASYTQANSMDMITHVFNGMYSLNVNSSSDFATVGPAYITCHMSASARPVMMEVYVLEQGAYDCMFGAYGDDTFTAGIGGVNVYEWAGTTVTVGGGYPNVNVKAWATDTNVGSDSSGNINVDVKKWAGTTVTVGGGYPNVNVNAWATDGAISTDGGGHIYTDVQAFGGNATQIAGGLPLTDVSANLNAIGLDHLVSASVAGGDITANSIIAKLVSKEATAAWTDFANTTDSLQALADGALSGTVDANIVSTDDIDLSVTQKASVETAADASLVTYGALKPTTASRTLDVADTGALSGTVDANIVSTADIDLSVTQKASVETAADASLVTYGALKPTTASRTLDVADTGEAGVDLGNVTGILGNANVSWVDSSEKVAVASVYHARVNLTVDGGNSQDEYTVKWFKDAVPVVVGADITSVTIQVTYRSGGVLVASKAMTVASNGTCRADEAVNRVPEGEAVTVLVTATIDSVARPFAEVVSRDAAN